MKKIILTIFVALLMVACKPQQQVDYVTADNGLQPDLLSKELSMMANSETFCGDNIIEYENACQLELLWDSVHGYFMEYLLDEPVLLYMDNFTAEALIELQEIAEYDSTIIGLIDSSFHIYNLTYSGDEYYSLWFSPDVQPKQL